MSSIRAFPEVGPDRARAGFTLTELLVALTISGVLITVIFQLLHGNSRFVQLQAAREEVQQNGRAALDLIGGDLRTVPPAALIRMDPDAVRFYAPRAFGVLCNTLDPSSTTAWVLFPTALVPQESFWGRPHWGVAVEQTTDPTVRTGQYSFVRQVTQQTTGDPCAAIQPALTAEHTRLGFVRPSGATFVASGTVPRGSQVLVFEDVQYDVAASATAAVPGTWLRRMAGYTGAGEPNMQPLAGPIPATGGLQLTYLQGDGQTETANPALVRRVRIRVITQSRAKFSRGGSSPAVQSDTATTEIFLRNFPG